MINFEIGNIYYLDSNNICRENIIRDKWMVNQKNDLRNFNSLYLIIDQGNIIFNKDCFVVVINNVNYGDFKFIIEVYEKLGIIFSKKWLFNEQLEVMKKKGIDIFMYEKEIVIFCKILNDIK